jgi:hypothetical protein
MWLWTAVFILFLLVLDLGVFHRKAHAITLKLDVCIVVPAAGERPPSPQIPPRSCASIAQGLIIGATLCAARGFHLYWRRTLRN